MYLTQEEICQALKDLPDGKAAGIDGILHELWKALTARYENKKSLNQPKFNIVKCLTTLYNDIERHGIAPPSDFPKGWMCPLYKKGDMSEISNYHPITILNTDYKIMTRALTTRLAEAVPDLIHLDQASDCHRFKNPRGLWVGYAGVRVRVGFLQPSPYPYPWCRLAGYPAS